MRKSVVFALGAAIVVLLGGTIFLYQKYRKTAADYAATKTSEETLQNRYTAAINSIAQIQDSLSAIVLGDGSTRLVGDFQTERKLTQATGDETLDRIAVLKAGVERTKLRIQQLEFSLQKSGVKVTGLQKMIANLKHSVADKETQIGQLSVRVDSLQTSVTGLTTEVQESQETIQTQQADLEAKRKELGTIYYVIGNKKNLTTSGVIAAKGGVLGLGKTLKPTGQVNESAFTPLDTDQQTVVEIPTKKAQVLSAQPPSSYQLTLNGGGLELRITDPKEFRKVKHLVILTS